MSSENKNFHHFQSFTGASKRRLSQYTALIIAVFFILATIISATAVTEDFSAVSHQKTVTVCGCSIRENTITVQNTGQATSVYELTQEGAAAPWSTLSETRFSLKSGESKIIHHFVHAPCHTQGSHPLSITIKTIFNTQKKLDLDVNVPQCNNVVVVPSQRTRVACPSQPVLYEFTLANPLSFPEVYELSVTPGTTNLKNADANKLAKSVSLSEHAIILGPQHKKKVLVFVQTPFDVYGDAILNLNIKARNSGIETNVPFTYFINQCYDFQLSIPSQVQFCSAFENRLPLVIENTAAGSNTYTVTAGILSADQTEETYKIGEYTMPGRVRQDINVGLDVATEPGRYVLGVDAQSARGTLSKYTEAALDITYCDEKGNPLSTEEYEQLQALLQQQEQGETPAHETGVTEAEEQADTEESEETEEPSLLPLFLIILILVILLVVLGLFVALKKPQDTDEAAQRREAKRKAREARKAARLERSLAKKQKKPKGLLLAILAILFIIVLLAGAFFAVKLMPGDRDTTAGNETTTEEQQQTEDEPEETEEQETTDASKWLGPLIFIAVLIIALALAVLAALLHKKQKKQTGKTDAKKPGKKVQETSDEPLIGLTKSVKELYEKTSKINKKTLKWILAIILLLLLLGGIVGVILAVTGDNNKVVSIDTEKATALGINADAQRVSIPAGTEATIPLVFKHPGDDFDRFVNLDFGIPWIETEQDTLAIKPGDDTHTDLTITKDAVPGKYNIVLEIKNEPGELFAADNLHIDIVDGEKSKLWKWLLLALALLILLALIVWLVIIVRRKRKKSKAKKADKKAAKKLTDEQIRAKEARKAHRKRRLKQGFLLLGLLLVVGLITWGVFSLSKTYMIKTAPTQHEPVEVVTEEAHDYILNVTGITQVPVKITNTNRRSTYHITVQDSEEWIRFDTPDVTVGPRDHETIHMFIEPHKGVRDGTYKLGVTIQETGDSGDAELFNSYLVVIMNKRGTVSKVLAYWLYILLGVFILALILVLVRLEAKKAHKVDLQDLAKEARARAKPGQKKSKYKMKRTQLKL